MIADGHAADFLSIQQLRAFCLVFERQSFTAAAAELGLSPPTIWEQVRALEGRYACVLFARRGRRIEPSPAATLLYDSLRPLLAGIDSTFPLLREAGGDYPRTLTLVTGARMMLEDLGPALGRFRQRFGNVTLRLMHGNAKAAEELVVRGEADLAMTLEPGPGLLGRGVAIERAYPINYLVLIPKRHPLAKVRSPALRDLVEHALVVGHRGTYGRQLLEQALHREGLLGRARIVAETDNSAFTIACVRSGMGVGVVAGRAAGFLSRDLVARSLQPQLGQAWIALLWKRGKLLSPTVTALIELVRDLSPERRLAAAAIPARSKPGPRARDIQTALTRDSPRSRAGP
jgi:DNA-binding transcriptional LysR family regulator